MSKTPPSFDFAQYGKIPEDKTQYIVQTPYGRGMVVRTRTTSDGHIHRELELMDWVRATTGMDRPATLYTTQTDFPSVPPHVGDEVVTLYGRGVVEQIRQDTDMAFAVVKLSSWRLAGRSRVTCTLALLSVQVVRTQRLYEMNVYEKVDYAQQLKQEASTFFARKDYPQALTLYARAVDAVRYVQHQADSSNHVRADLLLLLITCSNNAATCCMQVKQFDEALKFAKNASVLIEALMEKKGSNINKILQQDGYNEIKLYGEFYVKSLLVQGKALMEKGETVEAIAVLKQAHECIAKYTTEEYTQNEAYKKSVQQLLSNSKEVKKVHAMCKEKRKAELEKEKLRARAMFGGTTASNSPTATGNDERESDQEEKKETNDGVQNAQEESEDISSSTLESGRKPTVSMHSSTFSNTSETTSSSTPKGERELKKKRKVSFADQIDNEEKEVLDLDSGWDAEVFTGLGIFAVCAVGAAMAVHYLWDTSRRR
jgi:tetratricopeptide (TPR) repeat protein